MKLIIALAALVVAAPAVAQDWETIGESPKLNIYVDRDTVKRQGNIVTAWTKWVYPNSGRKDEAYYVARNRHDCENRTTTLLSYIFYNAKDEAIKSGKLETYQQKADDMAPGTDGEYVLNHVCAMI